MAVLSPAPVTVTSGSAVLVATGQKGGGSVKIATDEDILIGSEAAQNFPLYGTDATNVEYFTTDLGPGDELWAIAASTTASVTAFYNYT